MIQFLRITLSLALLSSLVACSPRFNREKLKPKALSKLSVPIMDLTAEGGSAVLGATSHFKVSRVAVGGNIQRIPSTTSSGLTVHGGPAAPR